MQQLVGHRFPSTRIAALAVGCVLAFSLTVRAQQEPASANPKPEPQKSTDAEATKPDPAKADTRQIGTQRPPAKKRDVSKLRTPKQRTATSTPRRRPVQPKFEMNPNAKWACDKTTVAVEPVWRGAREMTFEFMIRNEGTEDLQIRAKGG